MQLIVLFVNRRNTRGWSSVCSEIRRVQKTQIWFFSKRPTGIMVLELNSSLTHPYLRADLANQN